MATTKVEDNYDFTKHVKSMQAVDPAKVKSDVIHRLTLLSKDYNNKH